MIGKTLKSMTSTFTRQTCSICGEEPANLRQTDISLPPRETLQLRALQWLQPRNPLEDSEDLLSVFPHGHHPPDVDRLDIIIADEKGMLDFAFSFVY